MNQQNFKDQDISQNVNNFVIPSIQSSKYPSTLNTQRQRYPKLFNQINIYNKKALISKNQNLNSISIKDHKMFSRSRFNQKSQQSKKMQKKAQNKEKQLANFLIKSKLNESIKQRSIREFLESQYKFAKKIEQKKQKLKLNLQQQKIQQTFQPKTNKNSSVQRKEPIHQRLYNLRNKQNSINLPKTDFKPKIAQKSKKIIRDVSISQHLYNDALRRQQKHISQPNQIKQQCSLNKVINQKYTTQKFIKQFFHIVEQLNLKQQKQSINFELFLIILKQLKFITSALDKIPQNQKNLSQEAFKYISFSKISYQNICIFFMAILGIFNDNLDNLKPYCQINSKDQQYLQIDQNEVKKLHQKFYIFTQNRLVGQNNKAKSIRQSYSFKPEINIETDMLALNYRNKILEHTNNLIQKNQLNFQIPKDGLISHADLLQLKNLTSKVNIKKKRQLKQIQQLKECTFKPHIIQGKRQNLCSSIQQRQSKKKYESLYNLSKNYGKKQKQKSSQEIQYEKNKKQCTFMPNIKNKQRKKSKTKEKIISQDYLKMHKNKQTFLKNENQNKYLQPQTLKIHQKIQQQNQIEKQQLPYLVIDINLGDDVQQISIYKDQIDKLELVVEQFSIKHNLDEENKNKLLELLTQQINKVLNDIESY